MLQASFENKTRGNRLREKKIHLYPAKNFTFRRAVTVVKHHCRQLEKCMTQGNLNATQSSANEQAKNVWAHTRACFPLSCACMGKKRGPLSGCMRYFCWASHIEQTNNLFQLKRAADPVSAERGLCSIGSHHPFNQKKKKKKTNPPTLADCDRRGAAVLQEQIQREAWRWTERVAGRFQPGPRRTHQWKNGWGGRWGKEWRGLRLWLHVGVVSEGKGGRIN